MQRLRRVAQPDLAFPREPPAQAQSAIDSLKSYHLVDESSGGRATRYAHNMDRVLRIPSQSSILLTVLMLRGPQTAGELRIASERMHNFADISSVEGFLNELAERPAEKGGPLVVVLPRAPGEREARIAHLLCGPVEAEFSSETIAASAGAAGATGQNDRIAALEARVDELTAQLAALQAAVAQRGGT